MDEYPLEVPDEYKEEVVEDEPVEYGQDLDFDGLVDQVMAGEWGRGQAMRLALSRAGHDHRAVQAEIVRRANKR